MPINPSSKLFERAWSFSDRFATGDAALRADFDAALSDIVTGINAALTKNNVAQATLRIIGGSDTESELPSTALDSDAWVVGPRWSQYRAVYIWIGGGWRRAFDFYQPPSEVPGPRGPRGPQGPQGIQGEKGNPGNYVGINLIGASPNINDRPASATVGAAWGLIGLGTIRIYIWDGNTWLDAGPITSPESFPVDRVIHVQRFGLNTNSGSSWGSAVRNIERALELAELEGGAPILIEVAPDEITTQGHLDVPDNCVVRAAHRTVFVRPAVGYEQRNVFRLGSGCFIEGFMFEDFILDNLTNPTEGFAVSFRPGAVIRRVPYAHKIAVRTTPYWTTVAPPLDRLTGNPLVGIGGGVALADGAVCSQYSVFPNLMTWGATPVVHNGIGYCAKRGGLINAVNAVSMWCHKHFLALSGGHVILSSCSTQFGDYTMHADGFRSIPRPPEPAGTLTVENAAATAILAAQDDIIDDMWNALVAGGYTTGWTTGPEPSDEGYTRRDAATFIQCVCWALQSANPKPVQDFVSGLFDTEGGKVYDSTKEAAFIFSFEDMRDRINALAGVNSAAQTIVTNLVAVVTTMLTTPTFTIDPSRITAIGHTWTATMRGVALTKIPPAAPAAPIESSILETNRGVVVASGQDDYGNATFTGGVRINAETGMGGRGFDRAVRRQAVRMALVMGG